jgi:hypothetical protein
LFFGRSSHQATSTNYSEDLQQQQLYTNYSTEESQPVISQLRLQQIKKLQLGARMLRTENYLL